MPPITCEPKTVSGRLLYLATELGDQPFLTLLYPEGEPATHSYRQLLAAANHWTHYYQARGLTPGQRVLIILPHSQHLYAAYLGAVLGGLVPALFPFPSPKLSADAYARMIGALVANADARHVVTYPQLAEDLPRLAPTLTPGMIGTAADLVASASTADPNPTPPPPAAPEAPVLLQYSSGTTGLKKGVSITHRALLWQVDQYADALAATGADRIVSWLPLYHDMGLIACFWLPLLRGIPLVAMSPLDWVRRPRMLLEAVSRFRATLCWMPNFAYNHLAGSVRADDLAGIDLSSLRGVVNCSEPILDSSHEAFRTRFSSHGLSPAALWTCYALAENTFAATAGGADRPLFRDTIDAAELARRGRAVPVAPGPGARVLVSSGRALPLTKVRILDDRRQPLADRLVGEIALQSPCLMEGYFHNPQATADRFHDSWYLTGDLGYLADGELIVTGRKDDLIILAGQNIAPQDIEALVQSTPGVVPGRAVALGVHDPVSGTQKLVVLAETLERDPGRQTALRQEVLGRIAAGSDVVADDVRLLPPTWLAKSSSGKMARRENRERYLALRRDEAPAAAPPAPSGTPADRIAQVLRQALPAGRCPPPDQLWHCSTLISSGLIDSLILVNLILGLEAEFALTIPPAQQTALHHFESVAAMADLMARLGAPQPAGPGVSGPDMVVMSDRDRKSLDFLAGPREFDLLILGSSRVQTLSARLAQSLGYRAYNFGVGSAHAEDWYCILQFFLAHNRRPLRRVLLGIDLEAFTVGHGVDIRLIRGLHLGDYLDPSDRPGVRPTAPSGRREAVFLTLQNQPFETYRAFAFDPVSGDLFYTATDPVARAFNARTPLRLPDPTTHHGEYKMRMGGFTQFHAKRAAYFTRTVQACFDRGVPVTAFLTTAHPVLQQFLLRETTYADRLAELHRGLRANRAPGFTFLDCSTPATFGGSDDDFINPAHIGGYNADLLLRHLLADRQPG